MNTGLGRIPTGWYVTVKSRVLAAVGVVAVVGGVAVVRAAQTAASPAFEVVSVKTSTSDPGGPLRAQIQAGGRYTATNVPLTMLILQAYRMQDSRLVGAPSWASIDRFDVLAKAPGDLAAPFNPDPQAKPSDFQLMMRAMLADRFRLTVHTETRELPIYALVLARSDGRLGPKFTRSTTDCAAEPPAQGRSSAPPSPPTPSFDQAMKCGTRSGPGTFTGGGMTMPQIVLTLSSMVNRTVVDRTGLTGNFDVDLTFTPDQLPARAPGTPVDQPFTVFGRVIDPNGPSIFTALQEQLGLKLDSTKGPLDVLVIDSVEHPTEN